MQPENPAIDPALFRTVMGRFVTGVNVVGYFRDGVAAGLTVNAFTSVSLDPPLVLVSVRNASMFLHHVGVNSRLGVSMLAKGQQDISDHFGGRPKPHMQSSFRICQSVPLIEGAVATIIGRVVGIHRAGDHSLVIVQVESLHKADAEPLVFFGGRYTELAARMRGPGLAISPMNELSWWQ